MKLHLTSTHKLHLLILLFLNTLPYLSFSQTMSGTVTVGAGGDYTSLTKSDGLFNAVNTSTVTGNLTVNIISDISDENGAVALNQWTESGTGGYTLTIQSSESVQRNIFGNYDAASAEVNGIIRLNGADRVIISGGTGSNRYLVFRNYANGLYPAVLALSNDATGNYFNNCVFQQGSPYQAGCSGANSGVIYIGGTTGVTGNDNNTFISSDIGDNPDGIYYGYSNYAMPRNCFYAAGTAGKENDSITIKDCNIYNFSNSGSSCKNPPPTGIYVTEGNGNGWLIQGNSFFANIPATASCCQIGSPTAINFSPGNNSGNNTIIGNYIGGNASALTSGTISGTWNTYSGDPFGTSIYGIIINTSSSDTSYVSENTIGKISNALLPFFGIVVNGGLVTLDNNNIHNTSVAYGGNYTGIEVRGGSVVLKKNSVTNVSLAASTGGPHSFSGISITGGDVTVPEGIEPSYGNLINNISNINCFSGGGCYGSGNTIGIKNTGTGTVTLRNNTVSNMTSSFQAIGIYSKTTAGASFFTGNTVFGINSVDNDYFGTAISGEVTKSVVIGMWLESDVNASGNTVYNLTDNYNFTTGQDYGITGIYFNPSEVNVLEKNFVHSLSLTKPGANAFITGIAVGSIANTTSAEGVTVKNNMVRLGINGSGSSITDGLFITGIEKNVTNSVNIFHNSVYIGGSGVATLSSNTFAFRRTVSAAAGQDDVRNNIFANERSNSGSTGIHFGAVYNDATNLLSDYNLYYTPNSGGSTGSYDGGVTPANTVAALSTASGTGQESNSISGSPLFLNATGTSSVVNLHVADSSPAESAGQLISSVTDDYDSESRFDYTPVDIGADAINLLLGCPVLKEVTSSRLIGPNNCAPISLGIINAEPGVVYTLLVDGTEVESVTGDGNDISFTQQSAAGSYTVIGVNSSGCTVTMSGSAVINPNPVSPVLTGDTAICPGSTSVLTVSNPCQGCTYLWNTSETATSITVTPAATTTYTCSASTVCGSTSSEIVVNLSCPAPANIRLTNSTFASLTVSWDEAACAYRYKVRYKEADSSTWYTLNVGVGLNSKSIYKLKPGTLYEIQVRTRCDSLTTLFSSWSPSVTFPTEAGCDEPSGITVSRLQRTRVLISWSAVTGAYSYKIRYREAGATQWKIREVTAPTLSKTLTGLAAGTSYEFQIRTICSVSGRPASSWSVIQTFQTSLREEESVTVPAAGFTLFPNPNSGRFEMQFESSTDEAATIEIYNLLGQKVYSTVTTITTGFNRIEIELRDKPYGIYTVHLLSANPYTAQRILITK